MVHDGNASIDCPRQSHTKIGIGRELTLLHCWKLQHKPFFLKKTIDKQERQALFESSVLLQVVQKRALVLRKKGDATVPLLVQSLELAQKTTEKSFIYFFFLFYTGGLTS